MITFLNSFTLQNRSFFLMVLSILVVTPLVVDASETVDKQAKPVQSDDPADVKLIEGDHRVKFELDADGNIEELCIDGETVLTNPPLVNALKRLRHVHNLLCNHDPDTVLRAVNSWTDLEDARFGPDLTHFGLAEMEGMQKLKILLSRSPFVDDRCAKSIAKLKGLETLYLEHTNVRGAGLKELATLPNLRKLELEQTKVTDGDLKELANSQSLRELNLRGCATTDLGVRNLKGMKLESLNLIYTKVTNRCLTDLMEMKTLKVVEVAGTRP